MFNKSQQSPTAAKSEASTRPDSAGTFNTIIQGTSIEGNIISKGNIRFDGRLKGTIQCEGKVVVGPDGWVEGNIVCHQADISGKVQGNLQVKDLVTLKNTSDVTGDIVTGKLSIEPGAVFTGRCNMHEQIKPATPTPAATPSAAPKVMSTPVGKPPLVEEK